MHANKENILVSTKWVADNINNPSVIIVEASSDLTNTYKKGHIPNSIGWDIDADLKHPIHRDIPTTSQYKSLMESSGISNNSTVIIYGDGKNRSATWTYWIMKFFSHNDVRIMDGGRTKWIKEKRDLVSTVHTYNKSNYKTYKPNTNIRATKQYVHENFNNPNCQIIDTRSYEEYAGILTASPGHKQPEIEQKGHIPNAIHIPWDNILTENEQFPSISVLRELYETHNIDTKKEIITYCRLGHRASLTWYILKCILKAPHVRVYDGSWTEWGNSIGMPIKKIGN